MMTDHDPDTDVFGNRPLTVDSALPRRKTREEKDGQ
jgi:hypothetical protein